MADPDVLVVAIDEASIRELGMWPWPRRYHAEVLRRLAQARPRAVGLDVVFAEPSKNPAEDEALADAMQALRKTSPVYLPLGLSANPFPGRDPHELLPLPDLRRESSGLGHIHVALDSDGVARSLFLREGEAGRMWNALSLELVRAAGGHAPSVGPDEVVNTNGWFRESQRFLPFFRPGAHRAVPFVSVLRGEVPAEAICGKIVLLGVTATGMGDRYITPLSSGAAFTPGVEIHAAAVDALKNGRTVKLVAPSVQWICALIALGGWMLCLGRLGPRASFLGLFVFGGAVTSIAAALQLWGRYWMPVGNWLLCALLGYLVWSWRRLALLLAAIYLRAEKLHPLGGNRLGKPPPDGWQHVVQVLDESLEAKLKATHQRNDALQLLSHDLRSPQAAILALLRAAAGESQEPSKLHRDIESQVRSTLDLAEDFVALLRAEGDVYDWQEIDLNQLLIDVYDRAWPLAQAKNIEIDLQLPAQDVDEDGCWRLVEPHLLSRAIFNLVENAVKYCPTGSRILLALHHSAHEPIRLCVIDNGPGISVKDQSKLFDRYMRVDTADKQVSGHGLGLWFVRTVAERHGGFVTCKSVLNQGSEFVLTLPKA